MMYVTVSLDSERIDAILGLFGTLTVPVCDDIGAGGVTVDIERLPADVRGRLVGIGGREVTFVIALGDDCWLSGTMRF